MQHTKLELFGEILADAREPLPCVSCSIDQRPKMETGFNALIYEEDNLEHPAEIYFHQGTKQGWVNSQWISLLPSRFVKILGKANGLEF